MNIYIVVAGVFHEGKDILLITSNEEKANALLELTEQDMSYYDYVAVEEHEVEE